MKLLTVVGARPQFIKASVLSAEIARRGWDECLVHTGQHYDYKMSQVFFDQLQLKKPAYDLGVGSASHAQQTAEMMKRLEPVVIREEPDWVLVFGDTNSTLAGALVAAKLRIPVGHIEAGLRSFSREMPEEINRIVADHLADMLFAPTISSAKQIVREGIRSSTFVVGDLMVDLVHETLASKCDDAGILKRFGIGQGAFALATVHRASNTDNIAVFGRIVQALASLPMRVIFPVHPRTRPLVGCYEREFKTVTFCEPLSYFEMIALERKARVILTDSGGVQKEAYVLGVPCVTLRDETEWTETLEDGWNELAGTDTAAIVKAATRSKPLHPPRAVFGDGRSAAKIVNALASTSSASPTAEALTWA